MLHLLKKLHNLNNVIHLASWVEAKPTVMFFLTVLMSHGTFLYNLPLQEFVVLNMAYDQILLLSAVQQQQSAIV